MSMGFRFQNYTVWNLPLFAEQNIGTYGSNTNEAFLLSLLHLIVTSDAFQSIINGYIREGKISTVFEKS